MSKKSVMIINKFRLLLITDIIAFGGLVVSVLSIGSKVRRFEPGRGRWIFNSNKNP
jgi:hypothetical protein